MKILIINASDINGGAARAAYRLHKALLDQNIDSQMLVQRKSSDDYTVIGPETKIQKAILAMKIRQTLDNLPLKIYKKRIKVHFSTAWLPFGGIVDKINEIDPDIVHLHWINYGMIRIEDLEKIKQPIVWSLHDQWPFTAGYHYEMKERNYHIDSSFLEKWVFKRKQKVYTKLKNLTVIGLSRWIQTKAQESILFSGKKVLNFPNLINTDRFKPMNKEILKELFGLPRDKKLILFGAVSALSNPIKGYNELQKSLNGLKSQNIELVIFGSNKPKNNQTFGFKTHYLGFIHDDISLIAMYNAVDIVIVPSLQENLSNVIMESLSCGTPVVGFDIGGNSDMIEHKKNGYLAKPFDTADLANGIEWIINYSNYKELCQNAREKVLQEFDSAIVAKKYIQLYEDILNVSFRKGRE